MFYLGEVLTFAGDEPRDHRVVWADPRVVWLFDLGAKGTSFSRWSRDELEAKVRAGDVGVGDRARHDAFHLDTALTDKQKTHRDGLLQVVLPLVGRAPEIFDDRARGKVVAQLERDKVRSAKTVHAALDRWWRGGMVADALVPAFRNCGTGAAREGARKRGVQQPKGTPQGVPITPAIKDVFQKAIEKHYGNRRENPLSLVYEKMKAEAWIDRVRDRNTGLWVETVKPEFAVSGFPTLRQFRYWYSQHPDRLMHRRKRKGDIVYAKDLRPTTGSAREGLFGPGSRWEIDATELEIGCVSDIDKRSFVGVPGLYQVVDVDTGLIVGIYVGLENASWMGAGLAVRNAVEDKVAFCRRFDIDIEEREWPSHGFLPTRLTADNAEFKGDKATEFSAKSMVAVENARSCRGDDKGTVEGRFNVLKTELRLHLPGLRTKGHASPDGVDWSKEARLTLRQVTQAVIRTVILVNNRIIKSRLQTRAMMEDRIMPVPTEMWAWKVRRNMQELKACDMARAEFAMLPVANATITGDGFKFKKLLYAGEDPRDDAFAFAKQDGVGHAKVSYDPIFNTHIFVHRGTAELREARRAGGVPGPLFRRVSLTGDSREYRDTSFTDSSRMLSERENEIKRRQQVDAERRAAFEAATEALKRQANAARPNALTGPEVRREVGNKATALVEEREVRPSSLRPDEARVVPADELDRRRQELEDRRRHEAENRDPLGEDELTELLRKVGRDDDAT